MRPVDIFIDESGDDISILSLAINELLLVLKYNRKLRATTFCILGSTPQEDSLSRSFLDRCCDNPYLSAEIPSDSKCANADGLHPDGTIGTR